MKRIAWLLAAIVAVVVVLRSPDGPSGAPSTPSIAPSTLPSTLPSTAARENERAVSAVGFSSRARLEEHFQKHGSEFGGISIDEYLALAQALRDAPVGGDVLEVVRPSDGVISRFDRAAGSFLAADPDGTIRTFFKPNDGEAYFRRQAKRRPSP